MHEIDLCTAVVICSDQKSQMRVEIANFNETKDFMQSLIRYDIKWPSPVHMAYYIRGYVVSLLYLFFAVYATSILGVLNYMY